MNQKIEQTLEAPCPMCGERGQLEFASSPETLKVKGETFNVTRKRFICHNCEEIFSTPDLPDHLDEAYRMYRQKFNLLFPEAILQWRESKGMRQADVACLLGWSPATVSRYENGALQDPAHDKALRMAMQPSGLKALVENAAGLRPDLREAILKEEDVLAGGVEKLVEVVSHRVLHDSFAGTRWKKLCAAVLFFTRESSVSRTKLNKLLFYTDFLHFKMHSVSVTGVNYYRLQYGPVPERYELLFATMREQGLIDIQTELNGEYVAYWHRATKSVDVADLSDTEWQVVAKVQADLGKLSAADVSELSHKELAWTATPSGQLIPWGTARELSLSL
ncbi:MAG: DUF4065 domain-containing protein [Aurantimicrobium sp.]|uniref:type II TA system antitoxin MqsA family protein n=1 Tax=Comamonas sp. lk TaxID=2201272 RepID=UPI000EAD7088|nr:type II TA system antitoxin MqsA family protein [Comamonas sp. lk]